MFASLRARVIGLAILLSAAALSLGAALLNAQYQLRDAYAWVNHTQAVIIDIDGVAGDLRQAESGSRGYFLTGSADYLTSFDADVAHARDLSHQLTRLVADNPPQERRAQQLVALAAAKADVMEGAIASVRHGGTGVVSDQILRAHGKAVMDRLVRLAATMRATEHDLLAARIRTAETLADDTQLLQLVGWPALALLIALAAFVLLRSVRRPLAQLVEAVGRFGHGERDARVPLEGSTIEFRRVGAAYNEMADRLVVALDRQAEAEQQAARANADLMRHGHALEKRNASIELVSEMAQRLQALRGDGEFLDVLACFLPKALPDATGALYVMNNSRNLLVRAIAWGRPQAAPESFAPEVCWAIRRGQTHRVERPGEDIVCAHCAGALPIERQCEPVLASGEVLGLLYLEGELDVEERFRLELMVESIALALVNESLRKRLREQSIRDPLTGLFNRRYMEEALALETARAQRSGTSLAVIMADVDHFKRFNDEFGHDAGDAILKAVARAIQAQFRDGDIVCRYGGEEFTVITPGADLALIHARVEALRLAVGQMRVEHRGRPLGSVTMSFGIDSWGAGSTRAIDELIVEADRALYQAKRLGRNRIEIAPVAPERLAAE